MHDFDINMNDIENPPLATLARKAGWQKDHFPRRF
jgi:hypothetical protein